MAKHAKLSASGSARWLACPGSVKLEEGIPDTSSPYAKEGTLAHSIAESKLKRLYKKGFGEVSYKKEMEGLKKDPLYQKEMEGYTDIYVDEVKSKVLGFKTEPLIGIEERVDFSDWVPEGFGTADCILLSGREMWVVDLKYGKGVPVNPENNSQLMLYGLGAYKRYSLIYAIDSITLGIIQPRIHNIDYWKVSRDDLLEFGEKVRPIAKEASSGSDRLKEGDHCRFCKAKARCPERANKMFEAVEKISPFTEEDKKGKLKIKGKLSNNLIGEFLKITEGLSDWLKDLEDEAMKELLGGNEVPGYKLVEGRSNRRIKDEKGLAEKLKSSGYKEDEIFKPKSLETLTKLEKLVGKKEFEALSSGFIEKPQGKPTLVKESDKRPVYKKDARGMFKRIEN